MTRRIARNLAVAVTTLALVVAGGAMAAAAPTVKGSAASSSVVKGGSVTATLTATPATNGTAKLQYKSGTSWKTDSRAIKVTAGKGTTSLKPPADRTYRFSYGGAVSAAFTVKVTAVKATTVSSVKGSVPTAAVTQGTSVTATLTATPATNGTAKLQYKSGSTWKTDARSIAVKSGKGATSLKPPADRTYRFSYGGKVSNEFAVKVNAPAPTVKGSVPAAAVAPGTAVTATLTATPATNGTAKLQYKSGTTWKTDSRSIAVTAGKGTTSLKPPADRTYRFSYGGKVSNEFTVKVEAAPPAAPSLKVTVASSTIVKGASVTASLTATPATSGIAKLQYKSGTAWVTDARDITVTAGKGTTSLKPSADRTYRFTYGDLVSNEVTVKVQAAVGGSFLLTGSGWGHGVGMSQYGAFGMAKAGKSAAEILTHYYTGTRVETLPVGPSDLRVQVFGSGSDNANSVHIIVRSAEAQGDGQWRMRFYTAASDADPAVTWTGSKNENLALSRSGATVSVTRANGTTASGALITLHWEGTRYYQATSSENAYVELLAQKGGSRATHGQYRHGRMLITSLNNRINVVNSLDLNTEYLNGVAEVPSSWHASALEAQAVTARGYALRNLNAGRKAACACNVYDDTRSQNFSGWLKENEGTSAVYGKRWVAAVRSTSSSDGTAGQVLTYGAGGASRIATTYYFSSSGGQTENSEDVWSATISYLRAVNDPWSLAPEVNNPNASWTATLSQSAAASAFGLPNVATIAVTARTSSAGTAAAYKVTATSSTGATSTITGADNIRIKLGIKSPWLWSIRPN